MKRFLVIFFKTLLKGLLLLAVIIGGCVWLISRKESGEAYLAAHGGGWSPPSRAAVSGIKPSDLQALIADVYHVEQSRFIQPDILWVTLPAGADVQKTCQAIANVWAHRSGLDYVCVESWNGSRRLARATVQHQHFVTP